MAPPPQDDITAVIPEIVDDDAISPKDAQVSPKAGQIASPKAMEEGEKAKPAKYFPLWKLALVALPQLGVQVTWCFIGPNAAPYMLHLGVGPSLATLNNIAGPITGFFTGPIVGAWSDRLTSRFGRRRPIILAGLVSTWVAGVLFSAADHMFEDSTGKIAFAVPMYWIMDVTINILQTPYRALVSDLATKEQQIPMQVIFVFFMAIGNMIGYSIMKIWDVPAFHMLKLMLIICTLNTICIAIQFMVAKEEPLKRVEGEKANCCSPVVSVFKSLRGMPRLLYHHAFVQCLVWIGNTAWTYYASQWFAYSVYQGDQHAPAGSEKKLRYAQGMDDFSTGGQLRSGLQLLSALVIIALLMKTKLRPRLIYAPCILIGAVVSFLAGFVVGHAVLCPFNHARDGILCYPVRLGRNSQQACRRGRKASEHCPADGTFELLRDCRTASVSYGPCYHRRTPSIGKGLALCLHPRWRGPHIGRYFSPLLGQAGVKHREAFESRTTDFMAVAKEVNLLTKKKQH